MFSKIKIILATLFIFTVSLLVVAPVFAEGSLKDASTNLETTAGKAGTTGLKDLPSLVGTIINVALTMVGLIFLIFMVYAGYLWMTAAGEEEKVKSAQNIIKTCVIGLVIVLSAYAITYLLTNYLPTKLPGA